MDSPLSVSDASIACCSKDQISKTVKKVSKGSPSASAKRRPRTSPIWSYATQDPSQRITLNKNGQEVWICSLCTNKTTSYLLSGGTAAPIRHLLRVHHVQIPPSNSKNRRKSKPKQAVVNAIANTISNQLPNMNGTLTNHLNNMMNSSKQLLPSPVIKTDSNTTDSLSETIAASVANNTSNITNLATMNIHNINVNNPNHNSALFDVLIKYDVPAAAIPTPKFREFCSIVNPDAVPAINSNASTVPSTHATPMSSITSTLPSSATSSPCLAAGLSTNPINNASMFMETINNDIEHINNGQAPMEPVYASMDHADSNRLSTAPTTPISNTESVALNPAPPQYYIAAAHNPNGSINNNKHGMNYAHYTYLPLTPPASANSSSAVSSFSTPTTAFHITEMALGMNGMVSHPNASSSDGWYYPGLDSPITPITPVTPATTSAGLATGMAAAYAPMAFSNAAFNNINIAYTGLPSCSDPSVDQLFETPQQLMSIPADKLSMYSVDPAYDSTIFSYVEW